MTDNKKDMRDTYTIYDDQTIGKVQIADEVVAIIAGLAATEVEGVASMAGNITNELVGKLGMKNLSKGVKVDVLENVVCVNLNLNLEYGYSIPETCKKVQEKVKTAIENMTGLEVSDVNIERRTEGKGAWMKAPFFTTGEYEEKTMGRRELRESIFQLLFMTEFNDNQEMAEQKQLYLETIEDIQEKDQSYIQEKYEKIREKLPEIDAALNEASKGWKTSRMGKVELSILRLAVYELRYDDDVPGKVAINEAVELAKKFGGSEAPAFINGVLGKLAKEADE